MGNGVSVYHQLCNGEPQTYLCDCGRECPAFVDGGEGVLVIEHGEATYRMPREEWLAAGQGASFRLRHSSLMPWLDALHEREAA